MDVRSLQKALSGFGFNPGPADGVSGPKTKEAWGQFAVKAEETLGLRAATMVPQPAPPALGEILPPWVVTPRMLASLSGRPVNDNARSIVHGLIARGYAAELDEPHRVAHFLAQLGHESMGWFYDREVWGPTPAQERYDTRTDLGNTPERDGDGKKYMGRGPSQITGKANYREFYEWCITNGLDAPDFVAEPELLNTDPWEGVSAVWYWETRNLNRYADANDIEMITRRINGGLNGYADRVKWYEKTALYMLGWKDDVKGFQKDARLVVDGIAGPATRAALHSRLKAVGPQETAFKL